MNSPCVGARIILTVDSKSSAAGGYEGHSRAMKSSWNLHREMIATRSNLA